jgi:RHS repeat-associated protein
LSLRDGKFLWCPGGVEPNVIRDNSAASWQPAPTEVLAQPASSDTHGSDCGLERGRVTRYLPGSVTIPASEAVGALAGTYTVKHQYTANTGLLLRDIYSAQDGLPAEQVLHTYTALYNLPDGIGGLNGYIQNTSYDALSRINETTFGTSATIYGTVDDTYDPNSGRLTGTLTSHTAAGSTTTLDQQSYHYDLAGNLLGQTSTRNDSPEQSETQCFDYDGLDQLVGAWTAKDQCAAQPTSSDSSMVADPLGAGSAYWTTWTMDDLGDRTGQTQHAVAGGPATDTTTAYGYGSNGAQPHTLTSTATTGGSTGSTSYHYDAAGDMTSRNTGQGNQSITYDDAGDLTSITGSTGGDSEFTYDADGTLLIQRDPGTTTLYLGDQQFSLNAATGTVSGTRYYSLPGGVQAVRTGSGTSYGYELTDDHGTPDLYLDNQIATPQWRQYTPYGGPRGAGVTAPDNRGFLNKATDDNTGLTIVGARQYDPDTGRFITLDPELELNDPTQLNGYGYGYAGNNPVVHADPTGLRDDPYADVHGNTKPAAYDPMPGTTGGGHDTGPAKPKKKSVWSKAWGGFKGALHGANDQAFTLEEDFIPGACYLRGSDACKSEVKNTLNIHPQAHVTKQVGTCVFLGKACHDLLDEELAGVDCQDGLTGSCVGNAAILVLTTIFTGGAGGAEAAGADAVEAGADAGAAAGEKAVGQAAGGASDAAKSATSKISGCSFAAGTLVLMADGQTKPIDKLHIGDSVKSTDPTTTDAVVNRPVTALHDDLDTDMADVTIIDAAGKIAVIHTTQNHPFWDATTKAWTRADHLTPGQHLKSTTTVTLTVVAIHTFAQQAYRYNLTVAQLHTYYVLVGTTPALVHNCGGSGPVAGVLEVSDKVKSLNAFRNYTPSRGGMEYVFDPKTERLLVGEPRSYLGIKGSPHEQLARSGNLDEGSVLGGTFSRDSSGRGVFTENSGHYGQRWTPELRTQFDGFLDRFGIDHEHMSWQG